jgi:hypothetical protein
MLNTQPVTIPGEGGATDLRTLAFNHPDDVLHDTTLTLEEKRATLAAWASDAHAVPNVPALRQLPSGAIVNVDTVFSALRALDRSEPARLPKLPPASSWARPRFPARADWRWSRRRDDGDDDPPPCPSAAMPLNRREFRRRLELLPRRLAAA